MNKILLFAIPFLLLAATGFPADTKLEHSEYISASLYGADSNYLYGQDNGRTVMRRTESGVESYGLSFNKITPATKNYHGGDYSSNLLSHIYTTSTDGLIFAVVRNAVTWKYYLYKSVDGGDHFGDNSPNYDDMDYVLMLGDSDGTEANQFIDERPFPGRGFYEATIDGVRTFLVGEYQNRDPYEPVKIWKSTDGDTWTLVANWNSVYTTLNAEAVPGAMTLSVADTTGFKEGEKIRIGGNISPYAESAVIAPGGVLPGTLNLTAGLTGTHEPKDRVVVEKVRHVHGITQDPDYGWIYIYTGDVADAIGIIAWSGHGTIPDDNPLHLNTPDLKGFGGIQRYRVLGILFTPGHAFTMADTFDSDSERGIWQFDRSATVPFSSYTKVNSDILAYDNHAGGKGFKTSQGTLIFLEWLQAGWDSPMNVWVSGDDGATWKIPAQIVPYVSSGSKQLASLFEWKGKIYFGAYPDKLAGKDRYVSFTATLSGDFQGEHPVVIHPVYYVSPGGIDQTAGEQGWNRAHPWASLEYALSGSRITQGGRVIVGAGTYEEASITPDWSANSYPGVGTTVIEGEGTGTTVVYGSSQISGGSAWMNLTAQNGPVRLENFSIYSTKQDTDTIDVSAGSTLELLNMQVGNPLYDLGTGNALHVQGNVDLRNSLLDVKGDNDGVYVSGTGASLQSLNSIFLGGSTALRYSGAAAVDLRNTDFIGYTNLGVEIDPGAVSGPTIRDCIFSAAGGYAVRDDAGLSETGIDYNLYPASGVDPSVTEGGHSLPNGDDPIFVDAANGDYHLDSCSPAVDSGDPAEDFSLEPQPNGGRINLGRYGNTIEAAFSPAAVDQDGDGVVDSCDNCPAVANAVQKDTDGDGQGDACDADDDNDGLTDVDEINLYGTDPLLFDTDGDGYGDGQEVALLSDPNDPQSIPEFGTGDIAPHGTPDGQVNIADVLVALRIEAGLITPSPLDMARGDVSPVGNPDGVIDMADVLLILRKVMYLPSY